MELRRRFQPIQPVNYALQNGHCPVESDSSSEDEIIYPLFQVPWKSISLAVVLLLVGTALLFAATVILLGNQGNVNKRYYERVRPMVILGTVMLLSGGYHVKGAYAVFKEFRIEYEEL